MAVWSGKDHYRNGDIGRGRIASAGAAVAVKGTTTGITCDMDGKFVLTVPENSILIVSFVGFLSDEVTITNQTEVNITLLPDIARLDEVVIVGYGIQKKSLVTGSIAKVDSKDLANSVSTRFEQAIQGKTSGVVVVQNSGAPGSGHDD